MGKILRIIFVAITAVAYFTTFGQSRMSPEEYAEKYAPMAIKKMQQYGIPASITLAQGILESACGSSRLAVEANNHFGIKCKAEWIGDRIYHDDDELQECFRKYSSVEDSYNDHSVFLTTRSRYADLFQLEPTDYKGWAYGLKAAGYATSPTYAERLINIIEDNELYKYDNEAPKKIEKTIPTKETETIPVETAVQTPIVENDAISTGEINGVRYIIARNGDSFFSVSLKTGIPVKKLLKFNDLKYEKSLNDGDLVYIEKKAGSSSGQGTYIVKKQTTLYDISQMYGISYKKLLKINRQEFAEGTIPIGTEIHLR